MTKSPVSKYSMAGYTLLMSMWANETNIYHTKDSMKFTGP